MREFVCCHSKCNGCGRAFPKPKSKQPVSQKQLRKIQEWKDSNIEKVNCYNLIASTRHYAKKLGITEDEYREIQSFKYMQRMFREL